MRGVCVVCSGRYEALPLSINLEWSSFISELNLFNWLFLSATWNDGLPPIKYIIRLKELRILDSRKRARSRSKCNFGARKRVTR
jgi:hypothetical protein